MTSPNFEREGFIRCDGFLDADTVRQLDRELEDLKQHPEVIEKRWNPKPDAKTLTERFPRIYNPHRIRKRFRSLFLSDTCKALVQELLGEPGIGLGSSFEFKPPGALGYGLHRDNFYLRVKPSRVVALMVAIDPMSAENGGLQLVPGSHRIETPCPEAADPDESFSFETLPLPPGSELVCPTLASGDAIAFDGELIHGSLKNKHPEQWRRAFILWYAAQSVTHTVASAKPLSFAGEEVRASYKANEDANPCAEELRGIAIERGYVTQEAK